MLLRVVWGDLLGNAWIFTNVWEGATIEVSAMSHDGTTAFFLRNNGAEFDMVFGDKLLHAFQWLHAMADYPGTGTGLATVQRIIHRHGGRVWVEGQVGKGAASYFTLPEQA